MPTISCEACGLTETQAKADAIALSLLEEFQGGAHTCCEIAIWAREQALAWSEMTQRDNASPYAGTPCEDDSAALVLLRNGRRHPDRR
jgi:hypothetical protein